MDVEARLKPAMTAMAAWITGNGDTLAQIAKQHDLKNYDELAMWIVKEIVATYREAVEDHWRQSEKTPRVVSFETRPMRRRRKSRLD